MTSGAPRRHPHASAPPKFPVQTSVQLSIDRGDQTRDYADQFNVSQSEILRRAIDLGVDLVPETFAKGTTTLTKVFDLAEQFEVSPSEILHKALELGIDQVAATFHPAQVGAA